MITVQLRQHNVQLIKITADLDISVAGPQIISQNISPVNLAQNLTRIDMSGALLFLLSCGDTLTKCSNEERGEERGDINPHL